MHFLEAKHWVVCEDRVTFMAEQTRHRPLPTWLSSVVVVVSGEGGVIQPENLTLQIPGILQKEALSHRVLAHIESCSFALGPPQTS